MKHLFYSTCYPSPHLETELEIALDLLKKGDDVYFLTCNSALQTCFVNPSHKSVICSACSSKLTKGLDLIDLPGVKRIPFRSVDPKCFSILDELHFKNVEELKKYKYKDIDLGLAVASSLVSILRNHEFDLKKHWPNVLRHLKTGIYVYESLKLVLEDIMPDAVYMFNGRFIESRPLLQLCEQKNITFFTHERGADKDRFILIKNQIPHHLSRIIDDIEKTWIEGSSDKIKIGNKFFVDRRQGINQSWVSFTEDQKLNLLPTDFDPKKRNIAIFNTSIDEYESFPDFKNLIYSNDNEGIRKIAETFSAHPEFHFYLRVHPNLKGLHNQQMKEIKNMKFPNLTIILPEDPIDSYQLMFATEKTVTFGSTVGIEALYFKKPSVLLGRAFYENLNGLFKPSTHEEAVKLIKDDITVNDNSDAIKYGYWCSVFGINYKYYSPESLFKGTFLAKKLKSNFRSRVMMRLDRIYFDTFSQINGK